MKRLLCLLVGWLLFGTMACRLPEAVVVTATPTASVTPGIGITLITRVRPTTAVLQTTPTPLPTPTATSTATPIVYLIESGDTLLDLALRHGYTVADIEAANPGIRPELLQIGQAVVLPPAPTAVAQLSRATPVPLRLNVVQVQLYRSAAGGVWVVGELLNEGEVAAEAVKLEIGFVDGAGEVVAQTAVWAAASLIPPAAAAPFGGLLAELPPDVQPVVAIVAGQSVGDLGSRYLDVAATDVVLTHDAGQVTLAGAVENRGARTATDLRLIATFYDAAGRVSGFQVTELPDVRLGVGEKRPFSLLAAPPGGEVVGYSLLVQGVGE
jgi:LysM repeat protein